MSIDLANLPTWFSQRPKWLQDAARRLFQAGELTTSDLTELVILCKREAGIKLEKRPELVSLPSSTKAFGVTETSSSLRLNAIADVKGINALSPRNPLELGEEAFTIVYGSNGSGKSGYIRILKHMCGGRGTRPLQGNVFEPPLEDKSCRVCYTPGTEKKEIVWTPTLGVRADLRSVSLYDNDCAHVYVNNENEVAYEPTLLGHFRKLVEACQAVDEALAVEIAKKASSKPLLPAEYTSTKSGKWFNECNRSTAPAVVDAHCCWTEEQELELNALSQRLSEAHPADKAKALRKMIGHLNDLKRMFTIITAQLTDDAFSTLQTMRQITRTKRQAAQVDAKKVFENVPLTGVASESWRLLWEKARAYSELEAYKGASFPFVGDGARCVLCHQSLDADAKKRARAFEGYVNGALEAEAKEADNALSSLLESLTEVPPREQTNQSLDLSGITEPEARERIHDYAVMLKTRQAGFRTYNDPADLPPMPIDDVLAELQERESAIDSAAMAFDEDAKTDKKTELQEQVRQLAAQKWLFQQRTAIVAEIARLQDIYLYEQAKRLANTRALSDKKASLAETLITTAFTKRFEDELKASRGIRTSRRNSKNQNDQGAGLAPDCAQKHQVLRQDGRRFERWRIARSFSRGVSCRCSNERSLHPIRFRRSDFIS